MNGVFLQLSFIPRIDDIDAYDCINTIPCAKFAMLLNSLFLKTSFPSLLTLIVLVMLELVTIFV